MSEKNWKVNGLIRSRFVSVIDENSKKIGVMLTEAAITLAKSKDLDLVQVSEDGSEEIICKIVDFGRMKFQLQKNNTNKHTHKRKEIFISLYIGEHDLNTKINKVKEFIDKKYDIVFGIKFKNFKERHFMNVAKDKIIKSLDALGVTTDGIVFHTHKNKVFVNFK